MYLVWSPICLWGCGCRCECSGRGSGGLCSPMQATRGADREKVSRAQPVWWQVSPWAQMVAFIRGPEPCLVRDQAGGLPSLVSGSHQCLVHTSVQFTPARDQFGMCSLSHSGVSVLGHLAWPPHRQTKERGIHCGAWALTLHVDDHMGLSGFRFLSQEVGS